MSKPEKPTEKRGRGRPKSEIDLRQLVSLMRLSPNLKDTADFFDVCEDIIEKIIRENYGLRFSEFREKHAVHSRMGIKRKMIEKALNGDNTMLIWLSKNMLGMSDKVETKQEVTQNIVYDTTYGGKTLDELANQLDETNTKSIKSP